MQFFVTQPAEEPVRKSAGLRYARAMAGTALELCVDIAGARDEREEMLYLDAASFAGETQKAHVTTRTAAYGAAMRDSLAANGPGVAYELEVASVAVMDGDKILMGRRRDSGKWTLPGGGLERRETPHQAALRELAEETGFHAHALNFLGSRGVITELGKTAMIHAFHITAKPADITNKLDPDSEVSRWRWIDTSRGLPAHVASSLHSPRNVVLMLLDIYRSFGAGLYIADLVKSRSHKYLRKYRGRNGEWIYVYHEGEQHGRALTPEAHQHIRELADLGHEPSKQLIESTEEHSEEKLKALRELADLGHKPAHEHLQKLGIDRKGERKEEKAQELDTQILGKNELTKPLQGQDLNELTQGIVKVVKEKVFDYLGQHTSTPIGRALQQSGLTVGAITGDMGAERTVAGHLKALHEGLKKLDTTLAGQTSANEGVRQHGSYSNLAYNTVVDHLIREGYLPEAARAHKRTNENAAGTLELPHADLRAKSRGLGERRQTERTDRTARVAREAADRTAREARERTERETRDREARERTAREAAETERELGGSLTHHLSTITERPMSGADMRRMHTTMKAIFGGNGLTKDHWPYDFSSSGLKTKITSAVVRDSSISFELQIYNAAGEPIMSGWSRRWEKSSDGRPLIENSFMEVKPGARTGVQVGNLINQGQRDLMRKISGGGRVHVHANIDVGGYNWSNQGFSWDNAQTASGYRQNFKHFLAAKGIHLTDEDLRHFKEPVHFASFDDGKKYMATVRTMPLSQKQIDTKSVSGVEGEHPLTADEIRSGKTNRMVVHLGKMFMLGKDWYGTWDSSRNTDASKFADAYYQLRDRATKHLHPEFKHVLDKARTGQRRTGEVSEAPPPTVARASFGSTPAPAPGASQHVDRYLRYWNPRGDRANITMTARRLSAVSSWSRAEIKEFLSRAPLTRQSKERIRELMRAATR